MMRKRSSYGRRVALPFPLEVPPAKPTVDKEARFLRFERDGLRARIKTIDSCMEVRQMSRRDPQTPVSPLLALPEEVFRAIFLRICRCTFAMDPVQHPEVALSHVCRRWRRIAVECPGLWTVIRAQGACSLEKLEAYLERSRNQPLDIIIDLIPDCSEEYAKLIINTLRAGAVRFHRVHLTGLTIILPYGVLSGSKTLKVLELEGAGLGLFYDEGKGLGLDVADSLSIRVSYWTSHLVNTLNLQHLQILGDDYSGRPSIHGCFSQLATVHTNLKSLSLGADMLATRAGDAHEPLLLSAEFCGMAFPNLTHLRIADEASTRLVGWFAKAPRLEVLVLKDIPISQPISPHPTQVVPKFPPSLHTVGLINCAASPFRHGAAAFAEQTNHVRHLYILHSIPQKSALDEMAYQLPDQVLWPELQSLTIDIPKLKDEPREFDIIPKMMGELSSQGLNVALKVFEEDVGTWKKRKKLSWGRVNALATVEVLPEESRSTCIPWPTRDDGVFVLSSGEEDFQL